jgi:hypothetical protein
MGVIKIEKNNRKLLQSSPIVLQINTELCTDMPQKRLHSTAQGKFVVYSSY